METMNAPFKPNLYLLGFMGTGKTSVGKRLAHELGMRFIDSDAEIERRMHMKIPQIFAELGEARFRELEREFIESGHPKYGCVVSCGGGLVCRNGMPELVKDRGVCVVLFCPPETILERVSHATNRPLLNAPDRLEKIKTLLGERTPFYMKSGIAIPNVDMLDTVEHIKRIYASQQKRFLNAQNKKLP